MTELERERLITALAGAFERHDLAGTAHAEAGVSVPLADDDTAASYAARLVRVAERDQRLDFLLLAALRARPDNGDLIRIVGEALTMKFAATPQQVRMTDDRTNERLDQVISRLGELTGEVRAVQARVAHLEVSIEHLGQRRAQTDSQYYWTIVAGFIIAAAIIAATVFYAGAPR